MTIDELMNESYQTAKDKGWVGDGRTVGDHIALMHSELSEALEEYRTRGIDYKINWDGEKPTGFVLELADVMIRIAQFCEEKGIRLENALRVKMDYNKTRPYRHGGKEI